MTAPAWTRLADESGPEGQPLVIVAGGLECVASAMNVASLMADNAGYEDSTCDKILDVLRSGVADDASDDRDYTCIWVATDRAALARQLAGWARSQDDESLRDEVLSHPLVIRLAPPQPPDMIGR